MWKLKFISAAVTMACFLSHTGAMTNDKRIFGSAPKPGMYNLMHMMPTGKVMVMSEFDLLLTLKQYANLYEGDASGRKKRKAARDTTPTIRWPNCKVYYEIDETLQDTESKEVIDQAIENWEKYTCLEFIKSSSRSSRIQFRDGGGCYSSLGMQREPQPVALAPGCRTKGIVAHEIGHAIGFYHEHMRPDRDKFIKVNFAAIPPRFHDQFKRYNSEVINTYGVPYDYTSLMHYGSTVIPNSIVTLDKDYQDQIGQREGLTFKDIKLANLMYGCATEMKCTKQACPEHGFQFYKNHKGKGGCKCWCESGDLNDPLVLCSEQVKPVPSPSPVPPPTDSPEPTMDCMDMHPDCAEFKTRGQCETDMLIMMDVCAKTCGFCDKGKGMCMDHEDSCKMAAGAGLCKGEGTKETMEKLCPASCGVCDKEPPNPCDIYQEMMGHGQADLHSSDGKNSAKTRMPGPTLTIWLTVMAIFFSIRLGN